MTFSEQSASNCEHGAQRAVASEPDLTRFVEFHPDAEEEMLAAADYLDQRVPGLGEDFLSAVEEVARLARRNPSVGTPIGESARRLLLKPFPYGIIYRVREQGI
jgi:hypothetical protein